MYEYLGVEKEEKNDGKSTAISSSDFTQLKNANAKQETKDILTTQEVSKPDEQADIDANN